MKVLGGVSQKIIQPDVVEKLSVFLNVEVPHSLLTTLYRIEVLGSVYYSRAYTRVKKRNSYTVAYRSQVGVKYALIEYFLYTENKVVAILIHLLQRSFQTYHIFFGFHHSCMCGGFFSLLFR